MLRLSTEDELNNLPMPTVEVEVYHVYHVWWDFVTDTFPPLSLLTYSHHGGILSWWEYAGKPSPRFCWWSPWFLGPWWSWTLEIWTCTGRWTGRSDHDIPEEMIWIMKVSWCGLGIQMWYHDHIFCQNQGGEDNSHRFTSFRPRSQVNRHHLLLVITI